ncbi:hypothetical protein AB0942_13695 [Streptomyces nodosus]|uniref:hypothetical protein n=1 Tax=Streptomyces nodosus TaxID=40318 RepID=UPI00345578F7
MIIGDDNLLAGLDEVDWANLNHAYGAADDVPGQLRALCGDNEQAQRVTAGSLFNHLAHQGTPLSGISVCGAVSCPDRSRRPEVCA